MRIINKKNMSIIICIISSVFIVLKMYTGSNIFLWIFVLVACTGIVFDSIERKIEYLIYFVPWVYAIKFEFSQFSLFIFLAALYVIICLYYMLMHNIKINRGLLISFTVFVAYAVIMPLCSGDQLTETLGFILNYMIIFFGVIFIKDKKIFGRYSQIYAISLIICGIVRLISFVVPNISNYIDTMTRVNTIVAEGQLFVRFAGLDLDPNYFSIQILTAIACLLVNVYYNKNSRKLLSSLIIALTIFGIISLSKMFIIVLSILILISLFCFLKNNMKFALKYLYLTLLFGAIGVYYTSGFLYQAFLVRFTGAGFSAANITTGRSEIWINFLMEIINNSKVLIFGAGYGSGYLSNFIAHNMYLTALYYMGICGTIISFIYFVYIRKTINKNTKVKYKFKLSSVNNLPLYVVLIANFALDSFVMEYFPIHLLLVLLAMNYNCRNGDNHEKAYLKRAAAITIQYVQKNR